MKPINLCPTVFDKILTELRQIKELLYKLCNAEITEYHEQIHRQSQNQSSVSPEVPQPSVLTTCQK